MNVLKLVGVVVGTVVVIKVIQEVAYRTLGAAAIHTAVVNTPRK